MNAHVEDLEIQTEVCFWVILCEPHATGDLVNFTAECHSPTGKCSTPSWHLSPHLPQLNTIYLNAWLFYLNLQLRWLLHMVMYLTQYIWDYRHTDVRTKIFGWVLLHMTGVSLSVPHTICCLWKKSEFQSWSMSACTSRVVRLLQVILILGSCQSDQILKLI